MNYFLEKPKMAGDLYPAVFGFNHGILMSSFSTGL